MSLNAVKWLIDKWAEENAKTLQSMTDARPNAAAEPVDQDEAAALPPGTLFLDVAFSLAADANVYIAVPPEAAEALGQRTLRAAGIDDAGPEETQNTCLEILQQAHAGLAQAISARLKRAITSKGAETDRLPAGHSLFRLRIAFPESPEIVTFFAVSPALLAGIDPPQETHPAVPVVQDDRPTQAAASKTFDVLLDVSMPVSVSFGRTEMPIKEVLKLTTGSIVELKRSLQEPVDVIINDRVIARGEVVVVDGNYGVRVHHIISLQERLRSSTQATAMFAKTELNA
jgi:flagellar motor switch protein FliN